MKRVGSGVILETEDGDIFDQIMAEVDHNNDNKISLEEFIDAMT